MIYFFFKSYYFDLSSLHKFVAMTSIIIWNNSSNNELQCPAPDPRWKVFSFWQWEWHWLWICYNNHYHLRGYLPIFIDLLSRMGVEFCQKKLPVHQLIPIIFRLFPLLLFIKYHKFSLFFLFPGATLGGAQGLSWFCTQVLPLDVLSGDYMGFPALNLG